MGSSYPYNLILVQYLDPDTTKMAESVSSLPQMLQADLKKSPDQILKGKCRRTWEAQVGSETDRKILGWDQGACQGRLAQ